MAGMSITNERLETIDFTQNYFPPDPSLFIAAVGADIDPSALEGKRVDVQGGTIQAAYAEENLGASNAIVSFGTADLGAGNLDTILADGSYLEPVVAASNGAFEFVGEDVMIGNGVGAGLRKDETELKTKFDDVLTAPKKDGTVDKLIAQWLDGRGPYFTEQRPQPGRVPPAPAFLKARLYPSSCPFGPAHERRHRLLAELFDQRQAPNLACQLPVHHFCSDRWWHAGSSLWSGRHHPEECAVLAPAPDRLDLFLHRARRARCAVLPVLSAGLRADSQMVHGQPDLRTRDDRRPVGGLASLQGCQLISGHP